jgi:hypothetical protein
MGLEPSAFIAIAGGAAVVMVSTFKFV